MKSIRFHYKTVFEMELIIMLRVKGIYDGLVVKPIEPIPVKKPVNVIITIVDKIEDIELLRMKENSLSQYWNNPDLDIYNED